MPRDYNLVIQSNGKNVKVPIESLEARGWIKRFKKELDAADSISLIPLGDLPQVHVSLEGDKRWIYYRKIRGKLNTSTEERVEIKIHCIGWQKTIGRQNVKMIISIFPNGVIIEGIENE